MTDYFLTSPNFYIIFIFLNLEIPVGLIHKESWGIGRSLTRRRLDVIKIK